MDELNEEPKQEFRLLDISLITNESTDKGLNKVLYALSG